MSARSQSKKAVEPTAKLITINGTEGLGPDADQRHQLEVDVRSPRKPRASATTRSTLSSGKSRRSKKSEKKATPPPHDPSNVVLSRGRPMKPHETEPFLTIDNLPPEKTFISEKSTLSGFGTPRTSQVRPPPTPAKSPGFNPLQRMSMYMSPYSRDTPAAPSPSVVSGKMSPSKISKSPSPKVTRPRPLPGSRPNTGTKRSKGNEIDLNIDSNTEIETEHVLLKISKANDGSISKFEQSIETQTEMEKQTKADESKLSPKTRVKIDSRPSTASKTGSRPGTGSRSGRLGSGGRQRGMRSLPSRSGRVTPANTPFQSPNKLHAPNHHVKTPFKHHVGKPDLISDGRNTPSMGLKERTALAAYHINKMIAVAGEKDAHRVKGQLKKGKLKPLYPVSVDGPTIDKCRGIISETRSYESAPSRTLQRHLHLMNTIPNVHEYLYDRPRTVESVHRTSAASSIDDNFDYEEDDKLPDEIIYPPPKTGSILEPRTPENTFVPIQDPEEILLGETKKEKSSATVFATELSSDKTDDVTISNQLQQSLDINKTTQQSDTHNQTNNQTNNNNNNNDDNNTLNVAEVVLDDNVVTESDRFGSANSTQINNLRGVSSSKSVRFAEEGEKSEKSEKLEKSEKEMKQITNNNIAMQQRNQGEDDLVDNNEEDTVTKKNKQNVNTGSCKSDEIKEFRKKDKDDDDDEGEMDDNRKSENKENSGNSNNQNNQRNDNTGTSQSQSSTNAGEKDDSGKETGKPKDDSVLSDQACGLSSKGHIVGKDKESKNSKGTESENNGLNSDIGNKDSNDTARRHRLSKKSHHSRSDVRGQTSARRRSASSDRLHKSTKSEPCLKFHKSSASKSHTQKLEVSSVIHGGSVHVGFRPESPSRSPCRSPSRSSSPWRQHSYTGINRENIFINDEEFISGELFHEALSNSNSSRSKVKFLLENDEPTMETIFIEDDDDVKLKRNTQLNFDTLEAEISALRKNIRNDMDNMVHEHVENEDNVDEVDSEAETIVESVESDADAESVSNETELGDTVRGDYNDMIERYRQQCMDRSERCGAISTLMITPRENNNLMSSHRNSVVDNRNGNLWHLDTDYNRNDDSAYKSKVLSNPVSLDSGHGSIENISEFSRSGSVSVPDIPKLDLRGSTSDFGMDTSRSDMSVFSTKNEETKGDNPANLLELVCEQLSNMSAKEKKEIKTKRKDEEEDVTKLKVVATTKSLSKSKLSKINPQTNKHSYPPVCFTINAKPPAGYLYYFAYGPDMNPDRFKTYIMRDDIERYWGLLFGFNLVFNKKGTSEEAIGFSNIEFNPLRSVEGCIYKITPQELQVLDKCIGYPEHYQHLVLPVWMSNSVVPDGLGVAQYCVPALMFIAQNKWTEKDQALDYQYSLSQCIKSADLVTKEYRDSLVAMATQNGNQTVEATA